MIKNGEVHCPFCGFRMRELQDRQATEAKIREHCERIHPKAVRRSDELMAALRDGKITAREIRETLQREFGVNEDETA